MITMVLTILAFGGLIACTGLLAHEYRRSKRNLETGEASQDAGLGSASKVTAARREWLAREAFQALRGVGWVVAFVVVIGFFAYLASRGGSGAVWDGENAIVRQDESAVVRRVVDDWLEEQRKGRDAAHYWLDEWWVSPTKFFAVRSWEIVDARYGSVTVRVESSNGLRQPIVALWKVHLKQVPANSGTWKIFSVEDVDKSTK